MENFEKLTLLGEECLIDSTEVNQILQTGFKYEMIPNEIKEVLQVDSQNYNEEKHIVLNIKTLSENDKIISAVERGVAVLLHDSSIQNKSERLKLIDPTCEAINLNNLLFENLNGRIKDNKGTDEDINMKPIWLKRVEEKCMKEPNSCHIIFIDELINIQSYKQFDIQRALNNLAMERKVNGKWELAKNARIVISSNVFNNVLSGNFLNLPFAHVYIKSTSKSWLKWASENNIHPLIYTFILYKLENQLEPIIFNNGAKLIEDPKLWEMASNMLYTLRKPKMLSTLLGEELTKEFVIFCNQWVITIDDVIKGNYTLNIINNLSIEEKYSTISILSQVDENNLECIRNFVILMGIELVTIFDDLWIRGEESRLMKIREAKLNLIGNDNVNIRKLVNKNI